MSELLRFFKDMRDNGYGLAEIAAQLGTSAIAEPVAGFAAMYDPAHGADAIREGMTYTPRTQEAQQYSQSVGNAASAAIKPAMPIIDTWKKGVDIAGQYSPVVGAGLRTVPTAIGIAMGAKPALQTGRQVSKGLEKVQSRMVANATAPRTLNTGFRGQRGAIGLTNDFDNSDEIKIIADYLGQSPESMLVNRDLYTKKQGAINSLVSRYEQMDDFSGAYYPTSYGYISISPSAKSNGQWQLTSFDKKMNPLSDQGEMSKNKALTEFFKTIKPNKYGNITPVQTTPKRPLTEFEQAHLTAQRNAALPVNQGGLGLPADNTAMDRARAMGWDTDVYHGTDVDISEFDISRAGEKMKKDWGDASYHAPDTSSANYYATESGAKLAKDKAFKNYEAVEASEIAKGYKGHGWNQTLQDALKEYRKAAALAKETPTGANVIPLMLNTKNAEKYIVQSGMTDPYLAENLNMAKRGKDVAIIMNNPETVSEFAVFDPKKIRSRFAAFDPFNRDSSNLLATTAPLVPTTALGAYMYNENRKKSQGKQ